MMTWSFTITFVIKSVFSLIMGIEALKNKENLIYSLHIWAGVVN